MSSAYPAVGVVQAVVNELLCSRQGWSCVVAADLRRGKPTTTCRGSCCFGEWNCTYARRNPMPFEKKMSCNKGRDRGPRPPQRDYVWQGDAAISSEATHY